MTKKIQLSQGFEAIVDEEDFNRISDFKWHINRTKSGLIYARRTIVYPRVNGVQSKTKQYLHRFILDNFDKDVKIIFRDKNPLNCSKSNLIIGNESCKSYNITKRKKGKVKGVRKKHNKFHARIFDKDKCIFIGSFDTESQAKEAYDKLNSEMIKKNTIS